MKRSPHLDRFVILGIFCAAFSFNFDFEDEPVKFLAVPLFYVICSAVAIKARQRYMKINQHVELLVVLVGIVLSFRIGRWMGLNHLVFIGNGLVVYQLLRLALPISDREKKFSMGVALVHVAIGSMYIVDWKFPIVFILAFAFLPAALYETQSVSYSRVAGSRAVRLNISHIAMMLVITILFFFDIFMPHTRNIIVEH